MDDERAWPDLSRMGWRVFKRSWPGWGSADPGPWRDSGMAPLEPEQRSRGGEWRAHWISVRAVGAVVGEIQAWVNRETVARLVGSWPPCGGPMVAGRTPPTRS